MMAQHRISRLPMYQLTLPPGAVIVVLISYLLLNVGLAFLTGYVPSAPIFGIFGALALNLVVFLLLQPRWAIPLFILTAAPTLLVVPAASTGIISRLYPGNLLLALIIVLGLVQALRPQSKFIRTPPPVSIMIPLVALVFVGLISIMYSRIAPDPHVVYSFRHSNVSLLIVNISEMILLLGLPVILLITPVLVRTIADVQWIVRAYVGVGMVYALGTIFAAPLGWYSQYALLGNRRPEVFGLASSGLGLMLVLFTNIALGQALYATTQKARFRWWACTVIFGIAVIMAFGRTAWLALFLSVLVMLGVRLKSASVLLVALLFVLVLLFPGVTDFFNPDKVYGADRFNIFQDAISIWQTQPYFGVGAGNFQFFDIAYGTEVVGLAHNQFLQVLAEMGVQGLLCLVWAMSVIGWLTFQRFKAAMTAQGKAIALAYIGYYTAIIFSAFFTESILPSAAGGGGTLGLLVEPYHWLLLGVALTIPQWENPAQVAVESVQPARSSSVDREPGDIPAASDQPVRSIV